MSDAVLFPLIHAAFSRLHYVTLSEVYKVISSQ